MVRAVRQTAAMLKDAAKDFWKDECPRMAAALSYYTVFSLPPLLVLVVAVAGVFWDEQDIHGAIAAEMGKLVGGEGSAQIREILASADDPGARRGLAAVVGVAVLIFGATGAFIQLQDAINHAWEVEPDPKRGGVRNFILKRILSFAMILGVAFLLLVSLVLSTALAALGSAIGGGASETVLLVVNFVISFVAITALFGAMYKVMPDARIAWRDVWVGAVGTTILFMIGKYLLALYLGRNEPGDAFGAAGSLAVILIWIYYASMIVLFGAEFTEAWATVRGSGIKPKHGATRVVEKKQRIRGGKPAETEVQ
jgi:membrane protein